MARDYLLVADGRAIQPKGSVCLHDVVDPSYNVRDRMARRARATDWLPLAERDRNLKLAEEAWPSVVPPGWDKGDGCLQRSLEVQAAGGLIQLRETLLRLPSAPVHSLQRLHEHHVRLGSSEVFHSFRVLQRETADRPTNAPVTRRIFLMHNGLNERDRFELHYTLAANLIQQDLAAGTACIIRPFPGHLTRFPFQAFAETPLDRYLADGAQLFRQFARYMIETQWLLSALARRSTYRCASGANLLAEHDDCDKSRVNDDVLAAAILEAWIKLQQASKRAVAKAHKKERQAPPQSEAVPSIDSVKASISALRRVLCLTEYPGAGGAVPANDRRDPDLHAIGYSLGGSTAQSVFMSWPFLLSSCTAIHGGGPLRELAPTGFAHPEEWQTVLHSLRYELDDRLLSGELSSGGGGVVGMDRELFAHFKRTFYEVFQQDYRGGFQTRVSAFRQRLLFIVGGRDPIVAPMQILESAPPGGMNLLEIGAIGHFLAGRPGDPEEAKQRSYWIPELSGIIGRFADEAALYHIAERAESWFDRNMHRPAVAAESRFHRFRVDPLSQDEILSIEESGGLVGSMFERSLDDILARVVHRPGDGVLLILRNEIPTVMLHPAAVRERATAMYHDDTSIANYCAGIEGRRAVIDERRDRICFVLPWKIRDITVNLDAHSGYPSQSESTGGHVAQRTSLRTILNASAKAFVDHTDAHGGCVRFFNGQRPLSQFTKRIPPALAGIARAGNEPIDYVSTLPECWFWVSRRFLGFGRDTVFTLEEAQTAFVRQVPVLSDSDLGELIHDDHVRIVQVSRARYNPRYRGRLVVTLKDARGLLEHAALCIAVSDVADKEDIRKRIAWASDARRAAKRNEASAGRRGGRPRQGKAHGS